MTMLILGCLLFLGVHSLLIAWPKVRDAAVARWGEAAWKISYSVVAGVGLVLIIIGYGAARPVSGLLYVPPAWGRSATTVLMLPVFPLLLATYLPGRIQRAVKHPMLLATALWAFAHLLTNGGWADAILFGGFLVWAVADMLSFTYRPAKDIPRLPATRSNDILVVVGGLALYALFVVSAHGWITGIDLTP